MLKMDKLITYFLTGRGKFFPSGQALPIQMRTGAGQNSHPNSDPNSDPNSEKEAHVN